MRINCNGICQKFKAKKPMKGGRYDFGQKRCNSCGIFINYEGLFCPCCNIRLRQTSRYTKLKEKTITLSRI